MKRTICVAFAAACFAAPGWAQHEGHKLVKPDELKWNDVPSLPKGAKIAVIEGPMNEAVPFTVRLKLPADYKIPPHSHPAAERVTVLSGEFNMGVGDKFEQSKTQPVTPGAIMIMQPKTPHFGWTKTETMIQLHGTGPWAVNYVNPADDPRKQQ
jgi:quercetin dioxygenase-like cupin family protein